MSLVNLKNILVSDDKIICDLFMDQVVLGTLTAVDEIEFFGYFNKNGVESDVLAKRMARDPQLIDCICRVLTSINLLFQKESKYFLTDETKAYFLKSSPTYRGFQFYSNREHWAHKKVLNALNEGWSPIGRNNKSYTEMWEKGNLSQDAADRFTEMMHINIFGPAISIAKSGIFNKFHHIVDVGGGSGIFLAALFQHSPDKKLTLMELPQVCESSKNILQKYIPLSAVNFHGSNFFESSWPQDTDAFFLSNILHDWSYEKGLTILKNSLSALKKEGAIFICECLLDEKKVSPKHTVIFDLMMYMNHRSHQYTKRNLYAALEKVGFRNPEVIFNYGYYSVTKAPIQIISATPGLMLS